MHYSTSTVKVLISNIGFILDTVFSYRITGFRTIYQGNKQKSGFRVISADLPK